MVLTKLLADIGLHPKRHIIQIQKTPFRIFLHRHSEIQRPYSNPVQQIPRRAGPIETLTKR